MRKAILVAFGLVLTSSVLGTTVFREPFARAANPLTSVFINNGPDDPVPVREQNLDENGNLKVHEQGTAHVEVVNHNPVQVSAQQLGDWAVAVNGTPSVEVVNTDALPVRIEQPEPFQKTFSVATGSFGSGSVFFSAPDGKRLIVQHVSARVQVPDGATAEVGLEKWFPRVIAAASPDDVALTLTFQRQSGSVDIYHANEPAALIVGDADGTAIEGELGAGPNGFFVVLQTSGGDGVARANVNVSGVLEDDPSE